MKYIFELKNNYKNFDIDLNKNKNKEIEYDNSVFIEYDILHKKMKNSQNKKYYNLYKETRLINVSKSNKIYKKYKKDNEIEYDKIIYNKFNINEYSYFIVNNNNNLNEYYILNENKEINTKKIYKNLFLANSKDFYSKSPTERELFTHKNIFIFLYNLYDILEENGNILLTIYNYSNYKTYLIIFFVLSFFKKQIILFGNKVYCIGFNKNILKKKLIKNIFENNLNFSIKNNIIKNLKKLYEYSIFFYKLKIEKSIYLLSDDTYNLKKLIINFNLKTILEFGLYKNLKKEELDLFKLYLLKNNNEIFYDGNYINNIIIKYHYKKCLEIGSSEGIIPINILKKNILNIKITSLYEESDNLITNILKYYNSNKKINILYCDIIQQLIKYKKYKKYFNCIIINVSNYTLDKLFNIFLYSSCLIKKNDMIILNNIIKINNNVLNKFLKFIKKNFKLFKKIESNSELISYIKK